MVRLWKESKRFRFFVKIENGNLVTKPGSRFLQLGVDDSHIVDEILEQYYADLTNHTLSPDEEFVDDQKEEATTIPILDKFKLFEHPYFANVSKLYGLLDIVLHRGGAPVEEGVEQKYADLIKFSSDYEDHGTDSFVYTDVTFQPINSNSLLKYFFEINDIEGFYKFRKFRLRRGRYNRKIRKYSFSNIGYERLWHLFHFGFISNFKHWAGRSYGSSVRTLRHRFNVALGTVHTLRGRKAFRERKINFRRKVVKKQIYEY